MSDQELLPLFDYGMLNVENRSFARQMTDEIRNLAVQTVRNIFEIGVRLLEVKPRLGHGNFGPWLKAEFNWDERTAHRFMNVARRFKSDNLSDLRIAPSALYALAAPSVPEEARQEALDLAANGHLVSHGEAKQIIQAHKASVPEPSTPPTPATPESAPVQTELITVPDPVEAGDDPEDVPDPKELPAVAVAAPAPAPAPFTLRAEPWSTSEAERRDQVMLSGLTVLANQRCDHRLIAWAKAQGRYVPIDRTAYPLGNPMRLDAGHDRDTVIAWYRDHWIPHHYEQIPWDQLQGKVLGCWCYPEPCHGDVILENLSNEDAGHEAD